jgi:HAD superfamily hydrolase (TIGR01509 family)
MQNILNDIKAVVFDLDGTLIDSMWLWEDIDVDYLKKFGIELPKDLQPAISGMSFTETAQYFKDRFGITDSIEEIKAEWNRMAWEKYANEVPLKEGVKELLEFIKKTGRKAGIATSNSRELVELVTEQLGISAYFDSIRTSCDVKKGKPSPDIYLLVAKDLEVPPEECLVFEDVIQGVMAGKSAGMKVCAVFDQASVADTQAKQELADYYVESIREVI